MVFDRILAKTIETETIKALDKISKKYGVTIRPNGGTLGYNDFVMKLKIEKVGIEKTYSDVVFNLLGLPKDIIGKSFTVRNSVYTITELAPNRPKYPVIARNSDGKSFKFTIEAIKNYLKIK